MSSICGHCVRFGPYAAIQQSGPFIASGHLFGSAETSVTRMPESVTSTPPSEINHDSETRRLIPKPRRLIQKPDRLIRKPDASFEPEAVIGCQEHCGPKRRAGLKLKSQRLLDCTSSNKYKISVVCTVVRPYEMRLRSLRRKAITARLAALRWEKVCERHKTLVNIVSIQVIWKTKILVRMMLPWTIMVGPWML